MGKFSENKKQNTMEATIRNLENTIRQLSTENNKLSAENNKLSTEKNQLTTKNATLGNENRFLKSNLDRSECERKHFQQEVSRLNCRILTPQTCTRCGTIFVRC